MVERHLTAGAQRALELAESLAREFGDAEVEPGHLLWALLAEESRAFELLQRHGVSTETVTQQMSLGRDTAVDAAAGEAAAAQSMQDRPDDLRDPRNPASTGRLPESTACRDVLRHARQIAQLAGRHVELATEHLLAGLLKIDSPVQRLLVSRGLDEQALSAASSEPVPGSSDPMPVSFELAWQDSTQAERTRTYRILDAASNRAREGLRVVEDFVRFTLDDQFLSRRLKELRHRLTSALQGLGEMPLAAARDTEADVGTSIRTDSEMQRLSSIDVVRANLKRVEEALRTLEEFSKVAVNFDVSSHALRDLPAHLGMARYDVYTIEKMILTAWYSQHRLEGATLYLLLTIAQCRLDWGTVLREAISGGVRMVQVREKLLADRELVEHARRVRQVTADVGVLLIINDRPDVAVLCDADGVHVGQDELAVRDARRIIGPDRLVGVSTHSIEQARQAVIDGANYIGVGPTFRSGTKKFKEFPGLGYVEQVAAEICLPWFAIGGIETSNINDVIDGGAQRVAVSSAICRAEYPASAAAELLEKLAAERELA